VKRNIRFALLALPLLLIEISTPASSAQLTRDDAAVPHMSISPRVESTMVRSAIVAMRHVAQARSAIHRKALADARRDLADAARVMEGIEDDLSTSTVKNLIALARKHLEYERPVQVLHDLPPIYSYLENISIYLPTDRAKMHLDRAKGLLERDDIKGADRELALADKSLMVVDVQLPLLEVQKYVTKAQGYLAAGNAKKADKALEVAEKRALLLYTKGDFPLFQAKRNIWQALLNYSTVKAGPYLEQARNYLNKATSSGSARGKEEAGKLSMEVAELEKKLASEGKVAESALKASWEKSKALAERSAAYLAADISEEESTLKGENSLIEARLHVAYAETYQVTTMEPEKAVKELDTASSYLRQATKSRLAGPVARKKILGLERIIVTLKESPGKSGPDIQEHYETVQNEFSELIQEM
jgi:hypothetical protein